MAAVKGVNFTKSESPSSDNIVDPGVLGGRIRVHQDTFEAAALASGSTIQVGRLLQPGAKILDIQLFFDALGAGVTLDVGDAADANRYISAVVTTSAGDTRLSNIAGLQYSVLGTSTTPATTDDIIVITTGVGAATGTIKIVIIYAED